VRTADRSRSHTSAIRDRSAAGLGAGVTLEDRAALGAQRPARAEPQLIRLTLHLDPQVSSTTQESVS